MIALLHIEMLRNGLLSKVLTLTYLLVGAFYGLTLQLPPVLASSLSFPVDVAVVCSISIIGPTEALTSVSIECRAKQHVTIQVGEQLWRHVASSNACGGQQPLYGNSLEGQCPFNGGAPPTYGDAPPVYGGSQPSSTQPSSYALNDNVTLQLSTDDGSTHAWGLNFIDPIEHLQLQDSILDGLPLSSKPILYCSSCTYVTIVNMTLSNLQGNANFETSCTTTSFGALLFGGVREADVDRLTCNNVRNATDFACLWLTLELSEESQEGIINSAAVRISNSEFHNNAVVAGDCCADTFDYYFSSDSLGFGAVVLFGPFDQYGGRPSLMKTLELHHVHATGNTGGFGSVLAVLLDDGASALQLDRINISRSTLSDNEAVKHGGAVYVGLLKNIVQKLYVTDSSYINGNSAGPGGQGGAFKLNTAIGELIVDEGSSVSGNKATNGSGGAVYASHGIDRISISSSSNVSLNKAMGSGGAINVQLDPNIEHPYIDTCSLVNISGNSHVMNNTAGEHGGAFYMQVNVSQFWVTDNSSIDNNICGGQGGALHFAAAPADEQLGYLGVLILRDNASISSNRAAVQGGGIHVVKTVTGGTTIERDSRINNNSVAISQTAFGGGGISVDGDLAYLFVKDRSSISGNMVVGDDPNSIQGGAVFVGRLFPHLVVSGNSNISWNNASRGGSAVAAGNFFYTDGQVATSDNLQYSVVEVSDNSCICENTVTEDSAFGTILYSFARISRFLVTDNSSVSGNRVLSGAGSGGVVYAAGGYDNFTVCNGSSMDNNMGGIGGVLYASKVPRGQTNTTNIPSIGTLTLCVGSSMDGNIARIQGGVMSAEGPIGLITISGSSVSNNIAQTEGGALNLATLFAGMVITNSRVHGNSVAFGPGGFMSLTYTSVQQTSNVLDKSIDELPYQGPYFLNISNSVISSNSAIKNGGAINILLRHWITTVSNDTERQQGQQRRILYINVYNSTWDHNQAQYGAGGAISLVTTLPVVPAQKRLSSIILGLRVNITNTNFSANVAGDDSKALLSISDVSPLQGNGGVIFAWAINYPNQGPPLAGKAAEYAFPDDRTDCDSVEPDVVPGVPAFARASCWPSSSQACGVLLDGVQVFDNRATGAYGGGLAAANCAVKILDSQFRNNTCSQHGGGLAFLDPDVPEYLALVSSAFSSNSSVFSDQPTYQAAPQAQPQNVTGSTYLWRADQDSPTLPVALDGEHWSPSPEVLQNIDMSKPVVHPWLLLQRTTFDGNSARDGGGAYIEVNSTSAVISDCSFVRNQARMNGGGMMLIGRSDRTRVTTAVKGTNFTDNVAGSTGGGLDLRLTMSRAAVVLSSSNFKRNTAIHGGGIFNSGVRGSSLLCWGCDLEGNTANNGGAVALDYVIISTTAPSQNTTNTTSPPPSARPPSPAPLPPRPPRPPPPPPPGGNIQAFDPTTSVVHFQRCRLVLNSVLVSGGAVYLATGRQNVLTTLEQSSVWLNNASVMGGGVFLNASSGCTLRISGCRVSNNSAPQGGGAYATTTCGGQLAIGNGSHWSDNSASLYGGAIRMHSSDAVAISNTTGILDGYRLSRANTTTCQLVSLDLSNSTLVFNSAQQGGGVYVSQETVIAVRGTALANNTAWEFGGAIAAVDCNLLNVKNSTVLGNIAAFSGGGIFVDKCAVFIVELGQLAENAASTGGAIHVAGVTTHAEEPKAISRRLQAGAPASGSNRTLVSVNPVAILSRVDLTNNLASPYVRDVLAAAMSLPTATTTSPSANSYQAYSGHGGAIFVSGQVGVAVSNSSAGPGNTANVGTVLATTQVCSSNEVGAITAGRTIAEQLANMSAIRVWSDAVTSLSRAANLQCSPLIVRATKLPWSMVLPTASKIEQMAKPDLLQSLQLMQSLQLPLIWLQDLSVSALIANCSGSGDTSETRGISQIVQELIPKLKAPPPLAATENGFNLLPALVTMLQGCGDYQLSNSSHPMALAVPATHMRLTWFNGAMLVPNKMSSSDLTAFGTPLARLEDGAQPMPYVSSDMVGSKNISTFRGEDIKALVIAPNAYFGLSVQLYDGLGQPVAIDTPRFAVSLSIYPRDQALARQDNQFAALRANDTGSVTGVRTNRGIVSWTNLGIWGWPGRYVLKVSAVIDGGGGGDSSINSALPLVDDLIIDVELLPCEIGNELQASVNSDDHYSCTVCRRDQVGLWRDRRKPLSELLKDSSTPDTIWQSINLGNSALVNGIGDDGESCPSCCQVCPANGICPGGAILIPSPGFWHSAPNSPRMHRCPQPAACGKKLSPLDGEVDSFWGFVLVMNFNATTSTGALDGRNITNTTSSAVSNSLDTLLIMGSLRNENRSLLLAACQQWWYKTFPSNRDAVFQLQYNISRQGVGNPPCYLHYDAAFDGMTGNRNYMQLQCATGYKGHVCATCQPDFFLTVDFECMSCPPLARSITVGLLAFWGTVALILFTVFSNLSQTRAEAMEAEELSSLDLLKTLITHVQYFIIITKLGINYPLVITKYQSVLSALTGTENFIAYSPSCLFSNLDSAGQAATQLAFGLAAPCVATFVCLVLWAIRYLTVNQSLLRRSKGGRWRATKQLQDLVSAPEELPELPNSISREGPLTPRE